MNKYKSILDRLKNPSVILSIASQIVTIILFFSPNLDVNIVTGIIAALCSIFALLGITSDPTTKNKGYFDDVNFCPKCQKQSTCVHINGSLYCSACGELIKCSNNNEIENNDTENSEEEK